jgi:hypothetical protein
MEVQVMLLASVLLLISDPAHAATAAAKVTNPAAKPAGKKVCRSEYEVHSRIPRRVCLTETEWNNIYEETQNDLRNSRNDRVVPPPQ